MSTKIPLGRPYLDVESILKEVRETLETRWISGGPTIAKFEEEIKNYIGGGYPVAVANGTIAIDMALLRLNKGRRYKKKDEVIVPSWSWVATGFSPFNVGASAVWCDVNEYGVVEASTIEKLITPNTKAIVVVHQMGIPCDLEAINNLSIKYNIPVVEDAACGFGSDIRGVKIGNSRNLVTFSLQARKCLTTGEGGIVVGRNQEDEKWFKSYRAFGTSVSPLERDRASFLLKEQFRMLGSNFKISDISAAVGLAQLKVFDQEVILREKAGLYYNKLVTDHLSEYVEIANIVPEYCTRYNWQNYHIILKEGVNRDQVVDMLRKKGIGCKWDIQCIHMEPVFDERYAEIKLPNSLRFHEQGLWLPFFAEITSQEQEYVIDTLKSILTHENK